MQVSDFTKIIFYPVLLVALIAFFTVLGLHAFHHGGTDLTFETTMLDNTKLVLGALLGLITGAGIGYNAGKNENK